MIRFTIRVAAATLLLFALAPLRAESPSTEGAKKLGWKLTLQSWTVHKTVFESIDVAKQIGVKFLEIYPGQPISPDDKTAFGPGMSDAQIQAVLGKAAAADVTVIDCGVIGIPNKEEEARKLFAWAKKVGITLIVSEPEPKALPMIDGLAGEFGIRVGIHDHPKPSRYWDPEYVHEMTRNLKNVGFTADVGHWKRSGLEPADVLKKHGERVFSLHFKDLVKGDGSNGYHDVIWGTGASRAADMLAVLKAKKFQGPIAIEFEYKWEVATLRKCVEFFHEQANKLASEGTEPPAAKPDTPLAGTWLFDAAGRRTSSELGRFWTSTLAVSGDSFALSEFMGLSKALTGKIVLDASPKSQSVDLMVDEYDFAAAGAGVKMTIPAGTLRGIYKLDGDRLTACVALEVGAKRPTNFDAAGDKIARFTLVRTVGFKSFPKEIAVMVKGADGQPVTGVQVGDFLNWQQHPRQKEEKALWVLSHAVTTGADGQAKMKYDEISDTLIARDAAGKRMGIASVSPAALAGGEVAITLQPECRVTGTLRCELMEKAGMPMSWINMYLMRDGRRVAYTTSKNGRFEFVAPAGTYTLFVYSHDIHTKHVPMSVPEARPEFTAAPIALTASPLVLLHGKPAPELPGVVGWKGTPVKLADLKGKLVLLEFTGYWCGPCMQLMPEMIALHEKYAQRGLAIVGVHVDTDGEVDTAAKLDDKLAMYRKEMWQGKDVPFPMALVSGKQVGSGETTSRGAAAAQYGVSSYPTTVLIDRAGNVIGEFAARDAKSASAQIEKLLNEMK